VDGVGSSTFGVSVLAVMKQVVFVEEGFYAGGEDADPNFPCGLDEGDGSQIVEGDIVRFLRDWP
jgi:hypothetical protein